MPQVKAPRNSPDVKEKRAKRIYIKGRDKKTYEKLYHQNNREKRAAYKRLYYQKNKERAMLEMEALRDQDPEKKDCIAARQ
jgi:hypothetical protein